MPKRFWILIIVALWMPHVSWADTDSAVADSTPTAKPKSHFFRKIGNFVSQQTIGMDLPGGKDEEAAAAAPPAAEQTPGSDEMSRSQVDTEIHREVAYIGGDPSKMHQQDAWLKEMATHSRLPQNAAESAELDKVARDKGDMACMYWVHPVTEENLKTLNAKEQKDVTAAYQKELAQEAKGIRTPPDMGPQTSMWVCRGHVQEMKYQLAKASGDPAKIQQADADYAAFGHQMDAAEKTFKKGE